MGDACLRCSSNVALLVLNRFSVVIFCRSNSTDTIPAPHNKGKVGFAHFDACHAKLMCNGWHYAVGWRFAEQKLQNDTSLIEVTANRGEKDYRTRCCCRCDISIAVEGCRDQQDDEFLFDSLIDEDEFELMLWMFMPRLRVFPHRVSVFGLE